ESPLAAACGDVPRWPRTRAPRLGGAPIPRLVVVPVLSFRFLLSVLDGTPDLLGDVADLGLGGADILLEGALRLLGAIAGDAARDFLGLARAFLESPFNLVFVDSHDLLLAVSAATVASLGGSDPGGC